LVLIVFGTAMAVSLGVEAPLSYSVFSAASAAAAYAILGTPSSPHLRNRRKSGDGVAARRTQKHLSGRTAESEDK
jgi:hypothetical protein